MLLNGGTGHPVFPYLNLSKIRLLISILHPQSHFSFIFLISLTSSNWIWFVSQGFMCHKHEPLCVTIEIRDTLRGEACLTKVSSLSPLEENKVVPVS